MAKSRAMTEPLTARIWRVIIGTRVQADQPAAILAEEINRLRERAIADRSGQSWDAYFRAIEQYNRELSKRDPAGLLPIVKKRPTLDPIGPDAAVQQETIAETVDKVWPKVEAGIRYLGRKSE